MSTNNPLISIAHKIELIPNNKAKTHFQKAFGCARLSYNWGRAKWQEYYELGIKKSYLDLNNEFNSIKKTQFPFVYEVSKYATQQPFFHLHLAFQKFFRDLEKGKVSYPKFKKRKRIPALILLAVIRSSLKTGNTSKSPNSDWLKCEKNCDLRARSPR